MANEYLDRDGGRAGGVLVGKNLRALELGLFGQGRASRWVICLLGGRSLLGSCLDEWGALKNTRLFSWG